MIVFLDLEDEAEPPELRANSQWLNTHHHGNAGVSRLMGNNGVRDVDALERVNPNKEKAITKALGCYPYVQNLVASNMKRY